MGQFEATDTHGAHPRTACQIDELLRLAARQTFHQQMDVPQPQEIHGIGMMRDTVNTRDEERMHASRRLRMASKLGNPYRSREKLVEGQRVRKQPRAGNLPVEIEVVDRRAWPGGHVMTLRFAQFRVTLGQAPPSACAK